MSLKVKKKELLVYISLTLYTIASFFTRTALYKESNQGVFQAILLMSVIMMLCTLFSESKISVKRFFLFSLILLLFWVDSIPSGWHEFIYIFIMIWGCRNTDYKRTIRYLIVLMSIFVIVSYLVYRLGIMENVVYTQGQRTRNTFGYTSWTILPFQLLSLSVFFLYIKEKRNLIESILLYGINTLVFLLTNVKTILPLLIICNIIIWIVERKKDINWRKIKWLILLPEIAMALSYILILLYARFNTLRIVLDELLNYRLFNTSRALSHYGIQLLSNPNAKWFADESYYLIVDNSYYYILISWGVLGLALVLTIYSYIIWYSIKFEEKKLLVVTIVYVVIGLLWSRLFVLIEALMLIVFSNLFKSGSLKG